MTPLQQAAFDSYLPAFERMVPPLLAAYDALPATDTLKTKLAEPIAALRGWDYRWGASSVPTSLAVYWGERGGRRIAPGARAASISQMQYVATGRAQPAELVESFAAAGGTAHRAGRAGGEHFADAVRRDRPGAAGRASRVVRGGGWDGASRRARGRRAFRRCSTSRPPGRSRPS